MKHFSSLPGQKKGFVYIYIHQYSIGVVQSVHCKMNCNCIFRCFINSITLNCTIFGVALAVLGSHMYPTAAHHVKLTHFFQTTGITLIVVGAIITVVSFIGFLGNCCINKCLLKTFCILMIVLLVLELLIVVTVFFYYNEETLGNELKYSLKYYNEEKDFKTFWDLVNTKLECCGVYSVNDWGDNIPNSCCKDLNINDMCHKELANETPCLPKLIGIFKKRVPIGFTIISGLQVFCIITSFTLSRL